MAKDKPVTKKKGGPYLAAAFFCERVLQEKDESLTAVRLVDQIKVLIPENAPTDFPSKENRLPVGIAGLLSFKTGDFPGEHTIRIVMESPSGKVSNVHEQKIQFSDPKQGGGNLIFGNTIKVYKGGLFWFNVYLDGKLMTRMPLQVTYEREQPAQPVQTSPVAPTPRDSNSGSPANASRANRANRG